MDVFLKLPEIKMSSYGPVGWNQQPAEPQMQNHWRMFHGGVSLGVQLAYIYWKLREIAHDDFDIEVERIVH